VLATIEDVQGAVTVVTADGRSESAERGQPLFSGDELFTGEDDSFSVVRVDESRLKLAPETRVRVGRDRQTAEPGPMFFVSEGMVDAEGFSGSVVFRSTHAELRGMEGNFSFISLPDGTYVESGEGQGRLTRQSDGRSIELKKQQTVSVKPNDDRLVSQPAPLRVTKPKRSFSTSSGPVSGLYFDPVGTSLISAAGDSLKRWDLVSGKSETAFPSLKKRPIRGFSSSSDRQLLGLAADERHVKILDAESGRELWIQKSPPKGTWKVAAIAMSRDGRSLAVSWTGKEGNVVSVMDVSLGTQRTLHTGHVGPVTLLAFSPKSQLLATGGPDRSIRLWDLADLDSVRSFTKLPQEPRSIAFSPDEKHLAIGDRKGGLRMVNPQTGSEELQLAAHLRDVLAVVFAADGQTMVTTSADGTAKLWHVGRGQELASYKSHVAGSAAFSHDGLFFATGGTDKKIHLWELPRGK
jgi:WD40 repeat protein